MNTGILEPRYCPNCGRSGDEPLCPDDDTPTVRRVQLTVQDLQFTSGQVVAGRYKLDRLIGRGGFGAVYSAKLLSTGQAVAIKFLAIDFDSDGDAAVRRFFQEARVTSTLRHPNTVRVYDFGQTENGALYIAMELLVGATLDKVLRERRARDQPLNEQEVCTVGVAVLRSLTEAHSHDLVHRDLKPANILLAEVPGEEPMAKVLDFGIARTRNSSLTGGGKALGTPQYMSPEQCTGREVDGRSDLYSLAIVLYQCLAGKVPFDDDEPLAVLHKHMNEPPPDVRSYAKVPISQGVVEVLQKALAKKPPDRFANAKEMRIALEAAMGGAWALTPAAMLIAEIEPQATRQLDATPADLKQAVPFDRTPQSGRTLKLDAPFRPAASELIASPARALAPATVENPHPEVSPTRPRSRWAYGMTAVVLAALGAWGMNHQRSVAPASPGVSVGPTHRVEPLPAPLGALPPTPAPARLDEAAPSPLAATRAPSAPAFVQPPVNSEPLDVAPVADSAPRPEQKPAAVARVPEHVKATAAVRPTQARTAPAKKNTEVDD